MREEGSWKEACFLAGPEVPGLRSGQLPLAAQSPRACLWLSRAVSSSPSLPLCVFLVSPLAPQPLLISCTPLSLPSFLPSVSPPRSPASPPPALHFPLTGIDWPLGGFPSSPLATGSSLPPSGTIHFLPAQSYVSLYLSARAKSVQGMRGQEDKALGAPALLPSLQSLLPHGATHHLETSSRVPLRTPFLPSEGLGAKWGPGI